ncbi:cobalt-precorrin-7 (C(5))-methyltransferase [Methylobacter sp. S3L5C]|uniref:cobalt-precorrin-7 (C(5))-methyltransferase n=1 Tax=Methylobacter sp. S3L5C TaxID=2839024 RepID=UPI001FACF265|nr:cobalt-precorrin-7 (C(5))-methyltransferase [Methylobacter sp. S3L5C]UOA07105.1 cobalt-precorrin-7 (C(5))-methyltransferase [Methylobacter sp. S3L5C]
MIICIGAGPGDVGYLTLRGAELIRNAEVVAGFDAVVNVIQSLIPVTAQTVLMNYRDQTAQLATVAEAHHAGKRCVVVFMGDIHFSGFQYLERVERACGHPVETLPGISSAQILASRAKVCFDETTFITFHRRGDLGPFKRHLVHVLQDQRNAIVIPCPWDAARSFMPRHIATYLLEQGVPPEHPTEVWENLTRADDCMDAGGRAMQGAIAEAEWHGSLADCADKEFSDMSIMLIRTLSPMSSQIEP